MISERGARVAACAAALLAVGVALVGSEATLKGPNVCIDQTLENKTVNVSYLQSQRVKEYTWCLAIPPKCPVWKNRMVTKYKQKNISRLVNHHRCCTGYKETQNKTCEPVCSTPCVRGKCVEPDTCSCEAGFSGDACDEVGCPGGNWGPDCANECHCENNAQCDPHSGKCVCPPGYRGLKCQKECTEETFGPKCGGKCDCDVGETCNHVTGDCAPCPAGSWGPGCLEQCKCVENGTALCYHANGNCFCRPNHYGIRCELHCPFGYLDGVCHTEPLSIGGFCSCPSDLYRCDEELGCVCKDGVDCEGDGTQFIDFASLSAASGPDNHARNAGLAVTGLLLVLLVVVLVILYYRRRLQRLQKDLQNRSVLYIENGVLDKDKFPHLKPTDLVVRNSEPLQTEMINSNRIQNNAISNVGVAGPSSSSAGGRPEKNVNIDKYKLGSSEDEDDEGEDGAHRGAVDGACALPPRPSSDIRETKPKRIDDSDDSDRDDDIGHIVDGATCSRKSPIDVNLYQPQEYSPSEEKDNTKLSELYKKKLLGEKANVNIIVNKRCNDEDERVRGRDEDDDEDEEEELKANLGLRDRDESYSGQQ